MLADSIFFNLMFVVQELQFCFQDQLKVCPIDESHNVKESNMSQHVKICNARKNKMLSIRPTVYIYLFILLLSGFE